MRIATEQEVADLLNSLVSKPAIKSSQAGSAVTISPIGGEEIVLRRAPSVQVRSSLHQSR